MINYPLPRRIRFIPASTIFTASYNLPTIGKYDFAGTSETFIEKLLPHTVYLIDSISIGGNIAAEDYLGAIDIVPVFTLRKSISNEAIFDVPFPIQNYSTDRQIVRFFNTGLNNCGLIADISGRLSQTAPLVGLGAIQLSINLSVHAIDESDFEKHFKAEG